MKSHEIRQRFLAFFEERGHAIVPSASLIPENDPSSLFTTAGMQPLVPYLLGAEHPAGKRIANIQKCVRTGDIDDIGDNRHLTFFQMLGNWSLGDYFKKEAISWSYEFLTSKEEGLGLDPGRLYVTCFEGDENAPRDEESREIWMSLGIPEDRIYYLGADDNWWSAGPNGPSGPDTEMFYDLTESGLGDLSRDEFLKAVEEETVVEIWNDVFMEYEKRDGKVVGKLEQKNVDTGAGLERIATVMQKAASVYETDLFAPIIETIRKDAKMTDSRLERILADHVRASVFMISDGVLPSNTDQGYVLRRLLRRAIRTADKLGLPQNTLIHLAHIVVGQYGESYPELVAHEKSVHESIGAEEEKFRKTLQKGIRFLEAKAMRPRNLETGQEFELQLGGRELFELFTSHGFPLELSLEEAKDRRISITPNAEAMFKFLLEEHQEKSRAGAEQKFKGGLADTSEMSVKYHTATHLLNAALRKVLGDHIEQKGSNITPERLRFDFSHPEKMTDEQKRGVEDLVNKWIQADYPVERSVMSKDEAFAKGAIGVFGEKYGDEVSVYSIGDISMELCGGPHVERTGILGTFKIKKEESVSAGVRRIKATLNI